MVLSLLTRTPKVLLLSLAVHASIGTWLWFSGQDWVSETIPEPTVIEATILPPPVETPPVPEPPIAAPVVKAEQKAPVPQRGSAEKRAGADKQTGTNLDAQSKNDSGTLGHAGDGEQGASDQGSAAGTAAATAPELAKGVPIDAPIKDGGFRIWYDVTAKYKDFDANGGATFTFERNGANYRAVLSSKASVAKFNATSEGEIRNNTVATTRFRDGRTISFLGMGKERGGSNFIVDYPSQRVSFGTDNTQPLAYTAVYDYLAAMVYIQAVLQNKQGNVANLILPIGKRTTIEKAQVSFGAREAGLSTAEGVFEAIPATISIPSGSIQSMKIWFVPSKQYRPLKIEIGFKSGNVVLISRESN